MIGLGLRLVTSGGREAIIRLAVLAAVLGHRRRARRPAAGPGLWHTTPALKDALPDLSAIDRP
jgi:hypothetical protein